MVITSILSPVSTEKRNTEGTQLFNTANPYLRMVQGLQTEEAMAS